MAILMTNSGVIPRLWACCFTSPRTLCTLAPTNHSQLVKLLASTIIQRRVMHRQSRQSFVIFTARLTRAPAIVTPTGDLSIDCYVHADVAGGRHGRDPDYTATSAKSRTGYIITLSGCPMLWRSQQLQTEISLSTLEAEYSALSTSMRTLLPLCLILTEAVTALRLPRNSNQPFAVASLKITMEPFFLQPSSGSPIGQSTFSLNGISLGAM